MKVFISNNKSYYGGGCVLVAADSKEGALFEAATDKRTSYMFYHWDCDEEAYVQKPNDSMEDFHELEGMSYDGKPGVILDNTYEE